MGSVVPCQVRIFWESETGSKWAQTQCMLFFQLSRLIFRLIFFFESSSFFFFLWIHITLPRVPSDLFWFVLFYLKMWGWTPNFISITLVIAFKKRKAYLHWRLYYKVLVQWRVFVFKQLILYLNHSWKYPAAWAHCSCCLVSFWLQ